MNVLSKWNSDQLRLVIIKKFKFLLAKWVPVKLKRSQMILQPNNWINSFRTCLNKCKTDSTKCLEISSVELIKWVRLFAYFRKKNRWYRKINRRNHARSRGRVRKCWQKVNSHMILIVALFSAFFNVMITWLKFGLKFVLMKKCIMYRKKVWKWKINILALSWAKFSVLDGNIKKKLKMQTKENLFFIIKFEAIISFKRWERTLQ